MDEFEKIRAFSAELGKKTEEAIAAENEVFSEQNSQTSATEKNESADFLENWMAPTESVTEPKTLSKAFWIVLGGVSMLLVFLLIVIYLLLKGPMENEEVVTIAPTPTPVKVHPENPGGMRIPDQDKVIYSRLSQDALPVKVEKLFPEEEKPVMPEVTPEANDDAPVEEALDQVQIIQVPEPVKVESQKPEPKVEKLEQKPVKAAGEWKVQLFSSTDKAKVEKQWQTISKKQKALVSDMPMQIVPAKIAGKGTFYRLQVGAFETRQMAANLCAKLKKQKQDCIPAK